MGVAYHSYDSRAQKSKRRTKVGSIHSKGQKCGATVRGIGTCAGCRPKRALCSWKRERDRGMTRGGSQGSGYGYLMGTRYVMGICEGKSSTEAILAILQSCSLAVFHSCSLAVLQSSTLALLHSSTTVYPSSECHQCFRHDIIATPLTRSQLPTANLISDLFA